MSLQIESRFRRPEQLSHPENPGIFPSTRLTAALGKHAPGRIWRRPIARSSLIFRRADIRRRVERRQRLAGRRVANLRGAGDLTFP
jgi:hypothetical protein